MNEICETCESTGWVSAGLLKSTDGEIMGESFNECPHCQGIEDCPPDERRTER